MERWAPLGLKPSVVLYTNVALGSQCSTFTRKIHESTRFRYIRGVRIRRLPPFPVYRRRAQHHASTQSIMKNTIRVTTEVPTLRVGPSYHSPNTVPDAQILPRSSYSEGNDDL